MVAPVAAQEEKAKEDKSTKDAKDDKKKTKEEKKDEMTEEDKKLEEDLNMLVQRLSENDASLYQPSLETMRTLIRASTTSMTSVPKPLKFMRPHCNQMKQIFEKMEPGPTKTLCADIISVLAMCSDEKSDCINFRMKVSFSNSQLARIDPELARQAGESTLAYLTRVRQKMPSLPVPLIQRIAFMHEAARYRSQSAQTDFLTTAIFYIIMDEDYEPYVPQYVARTRSDTASPLSESDDDLFEEEPSSSYEELEARKRVEMPVPEKTTSTSLLNRSFRKPAQQKCKESATRQSISRELTLPVTTDGEELLKSVLEGNLLSLSKLGKVLYQIQTDPENKELLAHKMNTASINLQHVSRLQQHVNTLPNSSDSIVRTMTSIVREQTNIICGLSIAMDATMSRVRELEKQLQRTRYQFSKNKSKLLPDNCGFLKTNITKTWIIKAQPPFKEMNLISIFESWRRPLRCHKHDHYLQVLDFCRHFFLNACDPSPAIQKYACRQSGKNGKDKRLKDLPESLVTHLIDFVLDALGLYGDELLLPAADCARVHERYWTGLGENESQRRKRFDALSEARSTWTIHTREAISRALADVRQYEFDAARLVLVPPKKKRVITTHEGTTIKKKTELRDSPEDD